VLNKLEHGVQRLFGDLRLLYRFMGQYR